MAEHTLTFLILFKNYRHGARIFIRVAMHGLPRTYGARNDKRNLLIPRADKNSRAKTSCSQQ